MIEYAISTSVTMGDVERLPHLTRHRLDHVEIGFWRLDLLPQVIEFVRSNFVTVGFHDPLPGHDNWRWPSLNHQLPEERHRTLKSIKQTLAFADKHNPAYVLCHFPAVHFEEVPNWTTEDSIEAAMASCAILNEWSDEHGRSIILEHVSPHPYFTVPAFGQVFEAFPNLKFALDIGHYHLVARDGRINGTDFLDTIAPYLCIIHMYNATPASYKQYHHMPVHPSQNPSDGWADVPAILERVLPIAKDVRIVFEHTPQYPAELEFIQAGIDWIITLTS